MYITSCVKWKILFFHIILGIMFNALVGPPISHFAYNANQGLMVDKNLNLGQSCHVRKSMGAWALLPFEWLTL